MKQQHPLLPDGVVALTVEKCMKKIVILLFFFITSSASAGIIIGGTRLIFHGDKKQHSISIENPDSKPFLIQSWTEDSEGNRLQPHNAFIVTPPLFRLNGMEKNLLRIIRTASALPQDRETLFWLNIKSIPSTTDTERNTLQIAVRSRLKLIFRPESLDDETPEALTHQLSWKKVGDKLQVTNPTGYYMNFLYIAINGKKVVDGGLIAPRSSALLDTSTKISSGDLSWKIINDYGGSGDVHHASL